MMCSYAFNFLSTIYLHVFFFLLAQVEGEDELKDLAGKLTNIADEIPFIPPEIETDSPTGEFWFPSYRINIYQALCKNF